MRKESTEIWKKLIKQAGELASLDAVAKYEGLILSVTHLTEKIPAAFSDQPPETAQYMCSATHTQMRNLMKLSYELEGAAASQEILGLLQPWAEKPEKAPFPPGGVGDQPANYCRALLLSFYCHLQLSAHFSAFVEHEHSQLSDNNTADDNLLKTLKHYANHCDRIAETTLQQTTYFSGAEAATSILNAASYAATTLANGAHQLLSNQQQGRERTMPNSTPDTTGSHNTGEKESRAERRARKKAEREAAAMLAKARAEQETAALLAQAEQEKADKDAKLTAALAAEVASTPLVPVVDTQLSTHDSERMPSFATMSSDAATDPASTAEQNTANDDASSATAAAEEQDEEVAAAPEETAEQKAASTEVAKQHWHAVNNYVQQRKTTAKGGPDGDKDPQQDRIFVQRQNAFNELLASCSAEPTPAAKAMLAEFEKHAKQATGYTAAADSAIASKMTLGFIQTGFLEATGFVSRQFARSLEPFITGLQNGTLTSEHVHQGAIQYVAEIQQQQKAAEEAAAQQAAEEHQSSTPSSPR